MKLGNEKGRDHAQNANTQKKIGQTAVAVIPIYRCRSCHRHWVLKTPCPLLYRERPTERTFSSDRVGTRYDDPR